MTFLLFFITLSLLILVHEWGHFYAARRLGIRVEEFGFGFPPKLISAVKNGTRYVLNLFPIGGYVKIYGEHGEGKDERGSFASRPLWQRFFVVSAGVTMNLVLAWILFSGAHLRGVVTIVDQKTADAAITIVDVEPDSPAARAGMRFGDVVRAIRHEGVERRINGIQEFQTRIRELAGTPVELTLARNGSTRTVVATPRISPPAGSGPLGIALEYVVLEKSLWYQAPVAGAQSTWFALKNTAIGLWEMLRYLAISKSVPSDVSGPVGVFRMTQNIQDLGLSYILQFIAILSVNLAVLNALPIPALDGGRIFFMILEKFRRKTIAPQRENLAHAIGFAALIILMILITIRDVRNLF